MKKLLFCLLLAVPLSAAAMSNDDVIKMVKGGLNEATVVQVIGNAEPGFDTSPDGLVRLKQGGVSDRVIQQVIAKQSAAPSGLAPLPAQAAPGQPVAASTPPTADLRGLRHHRQRQGSQEEGIRVGGGRVGRVP